MQSSIFPKLLRVAGFAAWYCGASLAQQLNLADGPVQVDVKFHLPPDIGLGDAASPLAAATTSGDSLAFFTARYPSLGGVLLPFNIVGSDPSLGANTTVIPTVIVPLRFVFPGPAGITLDGSNVVDATANSPVFQPASYSARSVDLGFTQFGDALQRAQFWNQPGFSPDYHVWLGQPDVAPTLTFTVPAGRGNVYPLGGGGSAGVLDLTYFANVVTRLAGNYSAAQLPIFLTDNVFLSDDGTLQGCCILGYHSSDPPPAATARTWIYSSYAQPGTFTGSEVGIGPVDVVILSHEVAEWLNDPFVGAYARGFINLIPPAVLPGQGGACIDNFETGDPLEAPSRTFPKVTNGTTYHLQDEVFLSWYLHSSPSFSVNAWHTFQNTAAKVPLEVNAPADLAGFYQPTETLTWAPVDHPVTAEVVYVGRGCPAGSVAPGSPADPYLADPAGKIALIDRGACSVSPKVAAAAQAGAVGVLIGLVAPGDPVSFSYGGGMGFVPSLVIPRSTSNTLKNALSSSTVNATISPDNALPVPFSTLCGPG